MRSTGRFRIDRRTRAPHRRERRAIADVQETWERRAASADSAIRQS
jgi:hypothetical protein